MESLKHAVELQDLTDLWQVLRDEEFNGLVDVCHQEGYDPYEALLRWPSTPFDPKITSRVATRELAAYALRHAGFDVSSSATKSACLVDEGYCRVLLQCGGSVDDVQDGCVNKNNFTPDFLTVVASGNASGVRKLASLWCFPGMTKDGRTLLQLTKDCRGDGVSEYIRAFCLTMEVVYAVLANCPQDLRRFLKRHDNSKLKIDIRQPLMGGATPLFYAILLGNVELVRLLRQAGANPFIVMRDDDEVDMPILFAAFRKSSPGIARVLVDSLSEKEALVLGVCWFRGKSVLQVAFEEDCPEEVLEVTVRKGGPHMVCDLLPSCDSSWRRCSALEDIVYEWVVNPRCYPGFRDVLALRGFPLEEMNDFWLNEDEDVQLFCFEANPVIQDLTRSLKDAVAAGDDSAFSRALDQLKQLHEDERTGKHLPLLSEVVHHTAFAHCPGLPLLHFAVLHGSPSMVSSLVHRFHGASSGSVDEVRDFRRRTALHYAYAVGNFAVTRCLLLAGASEHTLDADGLEPLDFREWGNLRSLQDMLDSLKNKDLATAAVISNDLRHKLATKNPEKRCSEDPSTPHHCHLHSTSHDQEVASCHQRGTCGDSAANEEGQDAPGSSGSWYSCRVT